MFLLRNKKNYPKIITKYSSLTTPENVVLDQDSSFCSLVTGSLSEQDFPDAKWDLMHMQRASSGFQAGPDFSYYSYFSLLFFCVPTFPIFFLKMPYYPYFLVQKCLKWPKIVTFFLARSKFVKIGSS